MTLSEMSSHVCEKVRVVEKVLAVRQDVGEVANIQQEQLFQVSIDEFAQTGTPVHFVRLPRCVNILPAGFTYHDLRIYAATADAGLVWKVNYIDADGERQTVTNNFSTSLVTEDGVRIVERATKQATDGQGQLFANQGDFDLAICAAANTAWPQRLPIQLLPKPTPLLAETNTTTGIGTAW